MITMMIEEYVNDLNKKYRRESFASFEQFKKWFFGLCDGDYKRRIFIPDPNKLPPSRIEANYVLGSRTCYWIHEIIRDGVIIFSDGKLTSGQTHWNEEIKNMLVEMRAYQQNPKFNFG